MGAGQWRKKGDEYLVVRLATVERNENLSIADRIKSDWSAVGVKAEVESYPADAILKNVVKPRSFDALLYGQVTGSDPDPYAFWHSSQAETGQNVTGFTSKDADKAMEEARVINDEEKRKELYGRFQDIISAESPAIFLYSPTYNYVLPKKINGFAVDKILMPYDRFGNVWEWSVKLKKKIAW
jgi:peptide/nickel transport system substrate-binding protein